MRAKSLLRRLALVELVRGPAPPEYDYSPHNRAQRRRIARELQKAAKAATKKSGA